MGGGFYSSTDRKMRANSSGFYTKSVGQIFDKRSIDNEMNPKDVKIRESRDSEDHPESFPIIIALDVTGSMGHIPHYLVKDGFPHIMEKIFQAGIEHPQVMFMGIGDHMWDKAPLQIGQFESNDELLDKWLTSVYLEGGGGGNEGESYQLAWYFAANHTITDSFEKRGKKGILFTIGDEPVLKDIRSRDLSNIMGNGQYVNTKSDDLLKQASKMYHMIHLHITETMSGCREMVQAGWKQLMQDNVIMIKNKSDVSQVIADCIVKCYKTEESEKNSYEAEESEKNSYEAEESEKNSYEAEEIIL